jgi:hypothetical protein
MLFTDQGERYEGGWAYDMKEGQGILWSKSNVKYIGTFK